MPRQGTDHGLGLESRAHASLISRKVVPSKVSPATGACTRSELRHISSRRLTVGPKSLPSQTHMAEENGEIGSTAQKGAFDNGGEKLCRAGGHRFIQRGDAERLPQSADDIGSLFPTLEPGIDGFIGVRLFAKTKA